MSSARLLAVNGLIRIAAAASGQCFAFLLAGQLGGGYGSIAVGVLGASFFVTELVGAPVAGGIADQVGQIRVLRLGPVFGAVSALLAAAIANSGAGFWPLLLVLLGARIAEGSSAACAVPTTLVLLSRATRDNPVRRTRVMGLMEITSLLGMILGFALAGMAWDALGAATFLLLPPLYAAAWVIAPREEPAGTPEAPERRVGDALRRLVAVRGALPFGAAWLAVNAVVGLWIQYAPYLMKLSAPHPDQRMVGGFSGTHIGTVFAVWGLTFLIGIALWSFFAGGQPRRRVLFISLLGMLGVVASLAMFNHGAPHGFLLLAAGFVLVESGFTPAALACLADLTEELDEVRGVALGVYSLLLGLGQLAGTALGTPFVLRWQMDGVLLLTALLALAALAGISLMGVVTAQSADQQREARTQPGAKRTNGHL